MRVAVVGAGIGGLATAIGLTGTGARVEVLERGAGPRDEGSGLSIFGNGWTALDHVGAGVAARSVAGDQVTRLTAGQRRPDGRWLATASAEAVADLRVVHRAELHRVLEAQLPTGALRHGVHVRQVEPDGTVHADEDGRTTSRQYDLVVAADGIRSRIRSAWPGDVGVRYAGYSAWRAITREPVDLRGAAGETWGRGRRFGYAPLRDGRVYWFAVATMAADAVVVDEMARVHELFDGWHDPIADLLLATDPSSVHRHPIDHLAGRLPTYVRGRIVLIGDAAHAMTPDLGQGANQALEDAAELTGLLAPLAFDDRPGGEALSAVLRRYDDLRRPRTQALADRARRVGRVAQADGVVGSRLRDLAVRLTPGRVTDRQLEDVQAWRPLGSGTDVGSRA